MGWKAIKEHYRIGHSVQVVEGKGICIGSPYVHDLMVIADGVLVKWDDPVRGWGRNADLERYRTEMQADPAKLKELAEQPDTFERAIPVYTYQGADIIECACEKLGWPNVTHDGRMMYENTFSTDRAKVIRWAIRNAEAAIENWTEIVDDRQRAADEARQVLAERQDNLVALRGLAA
jgi:hypothetical protein